MPGPGRELGQRKGAPSAENRKAADWGFQENTGVGDNVNYGRHAGRYDVPDTPQLERVRKWILRNNVEHLQGPEEIAYEKDELVVLCLLYNGRHYLRSFIEHYFSLGAKHIVFLDNGSTDGTVEALRDYENVTVLRSTLHFKKYQLLLRQYLVERFGRQRWTLLVDQDELFDYPYSDVVDIGTLLRYLNEHSYTAVAAYMLDMFPSEPLKESTGSEEIPLKKIHRFYDLSNITFRSYHVVEGTNNVLSNEEIKMPQGGVQKRLFGIHPILLKHPLLFLTDEVSPADMSEHWACNVHVADFTGVLFHYKLSGNLRRLAKREVQERRYVNKSQKYDKYLRVLDDNPNLTIRSENSRELEGVNDLVGNGFLVVSPTYMQLVQEKKPSLVVEAFFRARYENEIQKEKFQREPQQSTRQEQKFQRKLRQKTRQVRNLQRMLAQENLRGSSLQRQLESVQASKTWRLLDLMNRLRKKILRRIGRS